MSGLIDAARTVIVAAVLWAGVFGAVAGFVAAVIVGMVALQPPKPRRGPWRGRGAPQRGSCDSSDAGTPLRASQTASRPAWARTDKEAA